jgi:hypothetical protein
VANSKHKLSSLLKQFDSQKLTGQSINKLLAASSLITQPQGSAERIIKPTNAGDARASAMSAKTVATGIKFGAPSSNKTSTSQSGSEWTNLLTKTASGGAASAFGGGGLGSIAGLGGLIAGIASLFGGGGGKTSPPQLVEFQLPSSQTQTVYVNSTGSSTYQGAVTQQAGPSKASGPMYMSSATPQTSNLGINQSFQYHSTQIAQAVKTALLNSSSLNDVIADI